MSIDLLFGALAAILKVVPDTLMMALLIMVLGIFLGAIFAFIRIKRIVILNQILGVLMLYVRGTPVIVQLYLLQNSLPHLIAFLINAITGSDLKYYDISTLITLYSAYIIFMGVYQCEVIRGALASIDKGQMEAAVSVGMSEKQALFRIIFPQAVVVAIPSFLTYYMTTIKMLSLAFTLQVIDIMAAAKLYTAISTRWTESYVAAAVVYWIIGILLTFLFNKWELYSKKRTGVVLAQGLN